MIPNISTYFKFKNNLTQFFLFLTFFAFLGFSDIFFRSPPSDQIHMLLILGVTCISIVLSVYILREKLHRADMNPLNIAITGIIILLLVHPTNLIVLFPLTLLIAYASKFIRFRSQPVFNPTAIGIIGAFYISLLLTRLGFLPEPLLTSWWAADMTQSFLQSQPLIQYLAGAMILGGFAWFTSSFRKVSYSISFAMTVFFLVFMTNLSLESSSADTIDFILASFFNSFAFLTLVMLPEPKTSPAFVKQQVVVAILAGIYFYYAAIRGIPVIGTENAFVETILVSNLLTLFFKSTALLR